MKTEQQTTSKQQRQILVLNIFAVLLIIWATATYFSEHPHIVTNIDQPIKQLEAMKSTQDTGSQDTTAINTMTTLMTLMQKLQDNPQDPQLLLETSKAFMNLPEWQQTEIFALKTIEINPNNPEAFYILGIAQHNQGKYAEAAKAFQFVLEKENDPEAQYNLGLLYIYYLDDVKKGEYYLKELLKNPKSTPELEKSAKEELKTKR